MPAVWLKIDPGLADLYSDYVQGGHGGRVNIDVQFVADLSELEQLGFDPAFHEDENRATGTIDLTDLERLAEHPGVVRIAYGRMPEPMLDVSVPQIRAKNGVWTLTGGVFGGATGAGAIVGIIDTGIDFRHPFFLRRTTPPTTRILRIWDPGLVPVAGESSPPPALLSGGPGTYGVEYKAKQINAHIDAISRGVAPTLPVRHRDCGGHGTHVASIAAGSGPPFTHVGVAPGADLIVVKFFNHDTTPRIGGVNVGREKFFRDCVSYILRVAETTDPDEGRTPEVPKPVVINCSFGDPLGPHDGLTDNEDWLTSTFSGAGSEGKIFVGAAGNSARDRAHTRIVFPAGGGTVEIPFELFDPRTLRREWDRCRWEDNTQRMTVHIYYPHGAATLSAAVDVGDGTGFHAGPALGGARNSHVFGGRTLAMAHTTDTEVLRDGRGIVSRNLFAFSLVPHNNLHRTGLYMLKVTSSEAMTIHMWCTNHGDHGLTVGVVDLAAALPVQVFVEDVNLIGSTGGAANTITVAAYNAELASREMYRHSSPGPLVRYGPAPTPPPKPDITAPGVAVDAAKSMDVIPAVAGATVPKSGTSMAAPHVTGLVALMLEKNPHLRVADVNTHLAAGVGPVVSPMTAVTANEAGAGRVDAKNAWDRVP
jgi:subtilisin family serine protease